MRVAHEDYSTQCSDAGAWLGVRAAPPALDHSAWRPPCRTCDLVFLRAILDPVVDVLLVRLRELRAAKWHVLADFVQVFAPGYDLPQVAVLGIARLDDRALDHTAGRFRAPFEGVFVRVQVQATQVTTADVAGPAVLGEDGVDVGPRGAWRHRGQHVA